MKFTEAKTLLPMDIQTRIDNFLKNGEILKSENPDFLCEGFCLYACMLALEFCEDDFSFLNSKSFYKNADRDKEIKDNLLKTKKYRSKSLSEEEISNIIQSNFLIDARNSLFHGNFEVVQEEGENFFLLSPARPHNPTTYPFKIRFSDIYERLRTRLEDLQTQVKEGKVTDKGNMYFKLLANCYVEMALFFSKINLRKFQTKDSIIKGSKLIAQQLLIFYECVYSQNEVYPILKNYPTKQAQLNIYRNSTAHANTTFSKSNLRFIDIDEKSGDRKEITTSMNDILESILDFNNITTLPAVDGAIEEIEKMKEKHPEMQEKLDHFIKNLNAFKLLLKNRTEKYYEEPDEKE